MEPSPLVEGPLMKAIGPVEKRHKRACVQQDDLTHRLSAEPAQVGLVGGQISRAGDAPGEVFGESQRGAQRRAPALLDVGCDGVADYGGLGRTALLGEGDHPGAQGIVELQCERFHSAGPFRLA